MNSNTKSTRVRKSLTVIPSTFLLIWGSMYSFANAYDCSVSIPKNRRTRDLTEKVYGKHAKKQILKWVTKAVESDKDDCEIELRCQERDSVGKYGRALGELWVFEDGIWTNVNKWMCEQGYAVPYVGQNKDDVKEQHMVNRRMLSDRGELIIDETGKFLSS